MDCKELIDSFNKVGGSLICDYEEKKVFVIGTNLNCKIQPKDYEDLRYLAHTYACSPYKLSHIKTNNPDKIINSDIKSINYYLKNDEIGFRIDYVECFFEDIKKYKYDH